MNKKLLVLPLILMIWVGFGGVIAITSNTFTVGLEAENLSFTGDQNITRYLSLNRWSIVNNANLTLTGIGGGTELNGTFEAGWDGWSNHTGTSRSNAWADGGSWSILFHVENGHTSINKTINFDDISYIGLTAYNMTGITRQGLYLNGVGNTNLIMNSAFVEGENILNVSMINGTQNLFISGACCSLSSCIEEFYIDSVIFYKKFDDYAYSIENNNASSFVNTTAINLTAVYDNDKSTCADPDGGGSINETWDVTGISNPYYMYKGTCATISAWDGASFDTLTAEEYHGDNEDELFYDVNDYIISNEVIIQISLVDNPPPLGCGYGCILTWYCDSDIATVSGSIIPYDSYSAVENAWLSVGDYDGAHEWNYTGFFGHGDSENTGNISSAITTALDGGACTGGTISGANCLVPFDFHSDDGGLLQYSDIAVDYSQAGIVNCTEGTALNFTLYHELNKSTLTGDLEATFTIYDEVYTFDLTSQSSFKFCLTLNASEAPADAIIQYESTGYSPRNYYLVNATLTNETAEIPLYLLPTTDSTTFEITVYNSDYDLQEDVIIKTQRYYVGTNTYETVDMGLTDEFGHALTHLQLEDAFYKFVLERAGSYLWSSTPIKPYCTAAPCSLILVISGENATDFEPYVDIPNFEFNLSWNETGTNAFRYEWTSTDGIAKLGRLFVEKLAGTTTTTICDESTLSAAGAIVCNITNDGQYRARAYADGDLVDNMYVQMGGLQGTFGIEGVFWTIILILTIAAIGLAFDARVAIILTVLSVIGVYFMGLTVLPVSSIAAIIVLAVVILYQMR